MMFGAKWTGEHTEDAVRVRFWFIIIGLALVAVAITGGALSSPLTLSSPGGSSAERVSPAA
jgi:hypothetical protein